MNYQERDKIVEQLFNDCSAVLFSKGKDYAGDIDCLANFKEEAKDVSLTKYQILSVYLHKHMSSIKNSIRANPELPQVESEPLSGRIVDAINYLALMYCMLKEDEQWTQKNSTLGK